VTTPSHDYPSAAGAALPADVLLRIESRLGEVCEGLAELRGSVHADMRASAQQVAELRRWVGKLDSKIDIHDQSIVRLQAAAPEHARTGDRVVVLHARVAWLLGGVAATATIAGLIIGALSIIARLSGGGR